MGELSSQNLPQLRWGIIGAGLISSWFVSDLVLQRNDARAGHVIQAIGSSSIEKGTAFRNTHIPDTNPAIYASYAELFADPSVDIVYVGTPHAVHKQNCLDAIAAGKHVLCEKPFTITCREAEEVLQAAKTKGVFVMEAMWTRFTPLMLILRQKLFDDKVIGDVRRTFCDFGLDMNMAALPSDSRLKDPALGAGSLLDMGIYSLTWGLLTLSPAAGPEAEKPKVHAVQSLQDGIDIATSIVIQYPSSGRQGILTSSVEVKSSKTFCRIEGTGGYIIVEGTAASAPDSFTIFPKLGISSSGAVEAVAGTNVKEQTFKFHKKGRGFFYEADAVALDIAAGRVENDIMPLAETLRVMAMMDDIRKQGDATFPQDVM